MKKKHGIALVCGTAIVLAGGSLSLYKMKTPGQNFEEIQKEKSKKGPTTEKELVADFEKRLTSYDPKLYPIPHNNLARSDNSTECKSGIGGKVKALDRGIFDESLYVVMAEKSDYEGVAAYAPYSRVTNVINDVIFEADVDTFDRKLTNQRYLMAGIPSKRIILTVDKMFEDTNSHIPNKQYGYPVGYLTSQTGLYTGTAIYNDACDKTVGLRKYQWEKIDLSGKKLGHILQVIPTTQTVVSPYGMFTFSVNTYVYLQQDVGDYLMSNSKQLNKMLKFDNFPKGSYVYAPKQIEVFKELMYGDINDYTALPDFEMEKYKEKIAKDANLDVRMVEMVPSQSGEMTLYLPRHKVDKTEISVGTPLLNLKGKWYQMNWTLPNVTDLDYKKGLGDLVYMNKKTHDHLVGAIKWAYQGLQLSQDSLTDGETKDTAEARQAQHERRIKEIEKMFGPEIKDMPTEKLADLKNPSEGLNLVK
ncbi:TPA: hypothetical protein ACGIK9_002899 [Acinetobacter baumannii]|uniref:hypothetical protein n=1 Tax=Acinetobacter baumannii TaxID=470 RepID=UPI0033904AAF